MATKSIPTPFDTAVEYAIEAWKTQAVLGTSSVSLRDAVETAVRSVLAHDGGELPDAALVQGVYIENFGVHVLLSQYGKDAIRHAGHTN